MVVDDNVDAAEVLAALCRLLDHDVVVEASSARQLRAQPETQRTVLAAVTACGQEQDRAEASNAGFD